MRIISRKQPTRTAMQPAAALVFVLALSCGVARGGANEADSAFPFEMIELPAFRVDESELVPWANDKALSDELDLEQLIPPRPHDIADPAVNLVPLPAPLASALLGVSALAAHRALGQRRTSAARVFRAR